MSYIFEPRLSFGGRFLSDVSTRNNTDANYKEGAAQSDLWNVLGGASVELLNCRAVPDQGIAPDDPAAKFVITGAVDQTSGKMVDLDPDWQVSSQLWGMRLRVSDPATGELAVEGNLAVCAFRDLWRRQTDQAANGQASGARFVSTLSDLSWGPATARSARLTALRQQTSEDKLSVGIHTFGYFYVDTSPRYRTGTVFAHIGPYQTGEPQTALVHRRLQTFAVQTSGGQPFAVVSDIDFALEADGGRGHFDIGHALLVSDVDGTLTQLASLGPGFAPIKALSIGLLPNPAPPLFSVVPPANVQTIVDLPAQPDWYIRTGGVVSVDLPPPVAAAALTRRLALFGRFNSGEVRLFAAETADGLFFRSDDFVQRLDPGDLGNVTIAARRFGVPAEGVTFHLLEVAQAQGAPGIAITAPAPTDAKGEATVRLTASDPGHPRAANQIDGQVFAFMYSNKLDDSGAPDLTDTGLGNLDLIPVHVRDPFPVPASPVFETDVHPFMAQFAQLYPIMSEHLFDISDYNALAARRRPMLLAFSRRIEDPNYMPVTRDLSRGKIETLVKWLSAETGDPAQPLRRSSVLSAQADASRAVNNGAGPPVRDMKSVMATVLARGRQIPLMRLGEEG